MLGVLRRRVLAMCLLGLGRVLLLLLLALRVLLDGMLGLSLLLVVEAPHARKGQRLRRRAGRALSVLVDGLAGRWVAILRGRRRGGVARWCWVKVVVRPGVAERLERRLGMFLLFRSLLLVLLVVLARASWRRGV